MSLTDKPASPAKTDRFFEASLAETDREIAEAIGLEHSFYVVGALVSVVMIGIAIYLWRNPKIAKAGED